jgi:hypothetical protein
MQLMDAFCTSSWPANAITPAVVLKPLAHVTREEHMRQVALPMPASGAAAARAGMESDVHGLPKGLDQIIEAWGR